MTYKITLEFDNLEEIGEVIHFLKEKNNSQQDKSPKCNSVIFAKTGETGSADKPFNNKIADVMGRDYETKRKEWESKL